MHSGNVDVASVLSHVFVRQFGLSNAWFVRSRGYDAIAVKNGVIPSLHHMSKMDPKVSSSFIDGRLLLFG